MQQVSSPFRTSQTIPIGMNDWRTLKLGQAGIIFENYFILVYIARWTSVISEEVCDMGSYRTRPSCDIH